MVNVNLLDEPNLLGTSLSDDSGKVNNAHDLNNERQEAAGQWG